MPVRLSGVEFDTAVCEVRVQVVQEELARSSFSGFLGVPGMQLKGRGVGQCG